MIREQLARIQDNMARAAQRSGRDPKEISLLAVSKTVPVEEIAKARDCGQFLFGENYLQEAATKIPLLANNNIQWHCIGHLQSNKAARAAELFAVVQTVDRLKIAQALDRHTKIIGKTLPVLVQVNIGREKQKSGVLPEQAKKLLREIRKQTDLPVLGLMVMPPYDPNPEASRPYFREIAELTRLLADQQLFENNERPVLSMGLSHDYEVAIEEGATMVRVGTALFGSRPAGAPTISYPE